MTNVRGVIITNAAADPAAAVLRMSRDQARSWLDKTKLGGRIVDQLPPPYTRKRSRSGHFVLVDDTLVMPLTRGREGDWLATGCEFFPAWLRSQGLGGEEIDPFTLRGAALADRIGFSEHSLDRYAQRAAGFPQRALSDREKDLAKAELRRILSRDARAVRQRPAWYRSSTPNDFFVVAEGEEICIPMRHTPGGAKPFMALTVLHQSMKLFEKPPEELTRACHFTPESLEQATLLVPDGQRPAPWLAARISASGTISWYPPRGHHPSPQARFYVHADPVYLPVAWDKQGRLPLVVLGVHRTKLPLPRRILTWLRTRFALRVN